MTDVCQQKLLALEPEATGLVDPVLPKYSTQPMTRTTSEGLTEDVRIKKRCSTGVAELPAEPRLTGEARFNPEDLAGLLPLLALLKAMVDKLPLTTEARFNLEGRAGLLPLLASIKIDLAEPRSDLLASIKRDLADPRLTGEARSNLERLAGLLTFVDTLLAEMPLLAPSTPAAYLQDWYLDNVERCTGSIVSLSTTKDSLYIAYLESCRRDNEAWLPVKQFARMIELLAALYHRLILIKTRDNKGTLYKGIRLRDHASLDDGASLHASPDNACKTRTPSRGEHGDSTSPGSSKI